MSLREKFCATNIILLIVVVFIKEFLKADFIVNLEIIFILLVLISGLTIAKGTSLYMSIVGLVIGHIVWFSYDMGGDIWFDAITKNLPLAILFVMVPVLSIPLKYGGYLEAFNYYVSKYSHRTKSLFFILSSFVFTLGSITNLGSVRVTHVLLEDVKFPNKFLASVYASGFATCITWSPYFGSVNLILYYTHVSFYKYLIFGFVMGVLALIVGNLLFIRDKSLQEEVKANIKVISSTENDGTNKLKQLALVLIGLLVLVVIGEKFFEFSNMMLLVSLIAFFYSALWSILINKFKEFLKSMKTYYKSVLQVKNEVIFFLSVGFFGVIIANTPIKSVIEMFFKHISGFSTFFLIETIIISIALFSCIGIHQVITVTTIALSLDPNLIGLSDISFALTLIAAWTIAMIFSPFAPFNIVVGGLLNKSAFKIGFDYNKIFGIATLILAGVYITLINNLFF